MMLCFADIGYNKILLHSVRGTTYDMCKKILTLLLVIFFCTGWTVAVISKPGSEELLHGYEALQNSDYRNAFVLFSNAYENAIDYKTKRRALEEIAKLAIDYPYVVDADPVALLEEAIQLGSLRANVILAELYHKGNIVPQNLGKAVKYYAAAADKYAKASFALAELLHSKQYFAQAIKQMQSEENPPTSVMMKLARLYSTGSIFADRDLQKAEYWYRRAMSRGNDTAAMELAELWHDIGSRDFADIAALWQQAASAGNSKAMIKLGIAHDIGFGGLNDKKLAKSLLERAVSIDNSKAYRIARWYEIIAKYDASYDDSVVYWFKKAAENGAPEALLKLARWYWRGDKLPQDRDKARKLFAKAEQAGSNKAAFELAEYERREQERLLRRQQHEQRKAERRKRNASYYKRDYASLLSLAKSGDVKAMYHIGNMLLTGEGVSYNPKQGVEWLHKAAENGSVDAMMALARAYIAGLGVEMNVERAYEFYKQAAKAGNGEAQYQLGMGYARGVGVPHDDNLAQSWLKKAREQGYILADEIYRGFRDSDGS